MSNANWQGLGLFPVWKWLHQSMCRHPITHMFGNRRFCLLCGKDIRSRTYSGIAQAMADQWGKGLGK